MFPRPRGTRDILPPEMEARRKVEIKIRKTFERFGYREIQTPVFEDLKLITEKSGEEITEHLYSFEDKKGRKLALRPELSAPTIRLFVSELSNKTKPRKLYYFENCFRYERPQKGRYREFWQAGIELIGSSRPIAEAEVVALAVKCLENIKIKNYSLIIGNRGILRAYLNYHNIEEGVQNQIFVLLDNKEMGSWGRLNLESTLKRKIKSLALFKCSQNKRKTIRSELEKKLGNDIKIIESELDHFIEFLEVLEEFDIIDYEIDFLIARGLDYYTGMVFEIFVKEGLGAQNQVCGGGTYSLVKLLGGEDIPSCGFGFGFDRLMLAINPKGFEQKSIATRRAFIIPTSKKALNKAIKVSNLIRKAKKVIKCDLELMGRTLTKSLSYVDAEGIRYAIIVEDGENDTVILKDMFTGEQQSIYAWEVVDAIK